MKKILKKFLIILLFLFLLIVIDNIQARILKNSPLISFREKLADNDSYVDKGILMDVYYCTKEKDIVTIYYKYKTTKFDCPIE